MSGFTPLTGHKFKFYRNTGSFASPVWSLIAEIGDLSLDDLTMGIAELKRRANLWTKGLASMIQLASVSFKLIFGLDRTSFEAMRGYFLAGTTKEYAIMSGAIDAPSGAEGWRLPLVIAQFPWNQALEEVSNFDVKMNLGYMISGGSEVDPVWLQVTSTTTAG